MADPTTASRLRGLILSASDLQSLTDWPDALIEDYLNIIDNLITLAEQIDTTIDEKIEEIDTAFTDGSIPFAETLFLVEDTSFTYTNLTNTLNVANAILSSLTASKPVFTNASKGLVSTGTLGADQGGTGLTTITDGGIMLGSGTGAVTPLAQATSGQIPVGSTGADPVLATITGTANQITVTNGAGSITLSLAATAGSLVNITRYTTTQILDADDHHVAGDTDGGAFTVTLPAGIAGTEYRIINTGTSSNNLTIAPNGAELLIGVNSNFILFDGEALLIVYEATEGWV